MRGVMFSLSKFYKLFSACLFIASCQTVPVIMHANNNEAEVIAKNLVFDLQSFLQKVTEKSLKSIQDGTYKLTNDKEFVDMTDSLMYNTLVSLQKIIEAAVKGGNYDHIYQLVKNSKKNNGKAGYSRQELITLIRNSPINPAYHSKLDEVNQVINACDKFLVLLDSKETAAWVKNSKKINKKQFDAMRKKFIKIKKQFQEIQQYLYSISHLI
jgi:hypothetical protein